MRGTGSHDYAITDLFVPEAYTLDGLDPPICHPSRLNALPTVSVLAFVIAATPLGIAMAAFDAFLALASVKAPISGSVLLRDKPAVQAMLGRMNALLHSAREFYYKTAHDVSALAQAGEPMTLAMRLQVRLAVAQVAEAAKEVARHLYDAAGGSSVYEKCPLERHFRDIFAVSQHVQVSPNNFEFSGRVLLGLDPGAARF
jgi:alkylation response protein AidB-like acyl-CoA dehydrogenase